MNNQQLQNSIPQQRLACLIVGRNLGDSVIQSIFLRKLINLNYARYYLVWTRPEAAYFFDGLPNCKVVTSYFPVGTDKRFNIAGAIGFFKALYKIRRLRPSVTIDLIGDFRERLFAKMLGSNEHRQIGWHSDHPFSRIIRNPFWKNPPFFLIPSSSVNVYEAHDLFLYSLTGVEQTKNGRGKISHKLQRVGLHPFASLRCKLWPAENWLKLAICLQELGVSLTVYGAPSERRLLEEIFLDLPLAPNYFTKDIRAFSEDVSTLDLMIGLDSFSVHIAEFNRVPSIMLNACNFPMLWAPPHCKELSNSGGCKYYPCMNVPGCRGTSGEYACIRSLEPETVVQLLLDAEKQGLWGNS